jgi:hypothetical protein
MTPRLSISISGDDTLQPLESGSPSRKSLIEAPVFIVVDKAASCGSSVLKYPSPHTLPGRGHEPHRAFSSKVNHDLSLSHDGHTATLTFSGRE